MSSTKMKKQKFANETSRTAGVDAALLSLRRDCFSRIFKRNWGVNAENRVGFARSPQWSVTLAPNYQFYANCVSLSFVYVCLL